MSGGAAPAPDTSRLTPLQQTLHGAGVTDPEVLNYRVVAEAPDLASLIKSHQNAQELIGRKGVPLPTKSPDEDPMGWNTAWAQLGRPSAPEAYKFEAPAEGSAAVDPEMESWFRGAAHEAGLTQWQAEKLRQAQLKWLGDTNAALDKQLAAVRAKADADLTAHWGQAREARLAELKLFLGDEGVQALDRAGYGSNPEVLKVLGDAVYRALGEDALTGRARLTEAKLSPADAQAEIDKLSRDQAFGKALRTPSDPNHGVFNDRWNKLHQWAGAGQAGAAAGEGPVRIERKL